MTKNAVVIVVLAPWRDGSMREALESQGLPIAFERGHTGPGSCWEISKDLLARMQLSGFQFQVAWQGEKAQNAKEVKNG